MLEGTLQPSQLRFTPINIYIYTINCKYIYIDAHSFVNVVNCGKGEGMHVLAQRAGNFFFRGMGLPTAVRKNQPLVPRSNLGGKVCARTDPWFRGQTLLVPGHGGGGTKDIVDDSFVPKDRKLKPVPQPGPKAPP